MKNTAIYLSLLLFMSACAYADIDLSHLNNYSDPQNSGQNIIINNKSFNTGKLRHTTVYPNGNMEGINQSGEYWTYDKSTNTYYNHTTGRICKGTSGLMSDCNK